MPAGSRPSRTHSPSRPDRGRRWLHPDPSEAEVSDRFSEIRYGCSGKHKSNPYLYEAAPYHGIDSDRTLCDRDAGFTRDDLERIPMLFARAKAARLIGSLIWTVDDSGWIYELRMTNAVLNVWHGYPLLPQDTFARQVSRRFGAWAAGSSGDNDRRAAQRCVALYEQSS